MDRFFFDKGFIDNLRVALTKTQTKKIKQSFVQFT